MSGGILCGGARRPAEPLSTARVDGSAGAELTVEVRAVRDAADDRVDVDRVQAEPTRGPQGAEVILGNVSPRGRYDSLPSNPEEV